MKITWWVRENELIAETYGNLPSVGEEVYFSDFISSKTKRRKFKVLSVSHKIGTLQMEIENIRDEMYKLKLDASNFDNIVETAEKMSSGRVMKVGIGVLTLGTQEAEIYLFELV